MTDELDMIPTILYASHATKRNYKQRKEPHFVSVEHVAEDVMNVNVFGPNWDYQVQVKISAFVALMKAEQVLES